MWEQITNSDRAKMLGGGGNVDMAGGPTSMADVVGCLAEKWKTTDQFTWVLDIRQGVKWQKIPNNAGSTLVNGRELTVDDVIATFEWLRDAPQSWARTAEPVLHANMTIEKTGPNQVTVHTPKNPNTTYLWLMGGGGSAFIWPKEWLPKYATTNDWKVTIGTGAYYITDFVDNSVLNMARNDNYWDKDPSGPGKGNQLPYISSIKFLIVPDTSTVLSALRTRKAEMLASGGFPTGLALDDARELTKTNPEMGSYRYLAYPQQIGMRRDKPDLPYKDINVRKALMMATDMESIAKDMYGGEAEILASPAAPLYTTTYTPLNEQPAETQELYKYNPDKAKQLLKDAGYPNGFNAKLVLTGSTDMAETIKAQWAKVNVNVTIDLREFGVFQGIWASRNYDELMMTMNAGGDNALFVRYSFGYFRGVNSYNISYVDDPTGSDPIIEKAFNDQAAVINVDFAAADRVNKEFNKYILSQAFLIPTPAPYMFRMWQPWLKAYAGEGASKHMIQYIWLDPVERAKWVK